MKVTQTIVCFILGAGLACGLFALPTAGAADADTRIPAIIEEGFKVWAAKDASYAFDVWKKGGLLESDAKPATLARYFARMDHTIGNYKSYETIQSKTISQSSKIVYLSVNFEQAAIYGRFLVYHGANGWVIQNMDFSPKPEAIMPWLSFAGEDYTQ
jgi:hypothetical protein